MERVYAQDVSKHLDEMVKVQGFVENIRNSKAMAFIVLKDITGKVQITLEKEPNPRLAEVVDTITPDSVITVTGKAVQNEYVKMGGIEILPDDIIVESVAAALPSVRKESRPWSAPALTSGLTTAGLTCARMRIS